MIKTKECIIQDVESYERDRKALLMLRLLAQGMHEIEQGKAIEQDELFAKVEKKFFS